MSPVWDAEVAVTTRQAQRWIESQFPNLTPARVEIMDYGFDNTVMRVNDDWVFRFPRRNSAVKLLEVEGQLLPLLEERELSLQIPIPAFYGKPSSQYKWPFLGYRFVEGTIPSRAHVVKRKESASVMARFLKKLHGTNVTEAKQCSVPFDELDRLHVTKRLPVLEKNIREVKGLRLFHQMGKLERYLHQLPDKSLSGKTTLVHGDLHFKNIVVNREGVLSGVLDWGDVHLGHRAVDFNLIFSFLDPDGRRIFLNEYGEIHETELDYARFKAIYTNVVLLLYGYHEDQSHTVVEAQKSLELALT
ncbi:phosphotransferase [Bacillus sp. BHET2]|uniref:phosphotransferase n=1 Tax=Bacillus sp. BHET2 TaxID=2583818 RepID=UPI001486977A|nr:phosphotransferase [Bacillus sp. BHET2]